MEETILTAKDLKFRYDPEQPDYALNGVSASTDQLTTLLDASTQIQNGIAQLDAGAAQLDEQVSYDAYKAILKENGLDLDQLKDGNAKAMEQLEQLVIDARFECTGPYAKLTTTEYVEALNKMLGLIRSIDEVNES